MVKRGADETTANRIKYVSLFDYELESFQLGPNLLEVLLWNDVENNHNRYIKISKSMKREKTGSLKNAKP